MITINLSLTEANLVLTAMRQATAYSNDFPLLESVIDTLQHQINCEVDSLDEPCDGFRTDAEADSDALASAGWGMDEDYRHQPEDAGLDEYWESQTEIEVPEYDF